MLKVGFVHAGNGPAPVHLPANAKGVLFLNDEMLAAYPLESDTDAEIFDRMPTPLDSNSFIMVDKSSGKRVTPSIKKLDIGSSNFQPGDYRKLVSISRKLTGCLGLHSLDRSCQPIAAKLYRSGWSDAFLKNGELIDITKQYNASIFKRSHGYFLIAPNGGFHAGSTYEIRYARNDTPTMYPIRILVTIDTIPVSLPSEHFTLTQEGEAKRQNGSYWSCGGVRTGAPETTRTVGYIVPKAFRAYQHSILFIAKTAKHANANQTINPATDIYRLGYTEYHDSEAFDVSSDCKEDTGTPAPVFVQGAAAFVEVSPIMYDTPTFQVNFDHASGPSCRELEQKVDNSPALY